MNVYHCVGCNETFQASHDCVAVDCTQGGPVRKATPAEIFDYLSDEDPTAGFDIPQDGRWERP